MATRNVTSVRVSMIALGGPKLKLRYPGIRARSYMTETALLRNLTYIKNYKNSVI